MGSTDGKHKRRRNTKAEAVTLFRADHTCCVCRTSHKDVAIHHIDGDPGNDNPDNLAVVCLDCHSKVTGGRGLGRPISPSELRMYKRAWEQRVASIRGVHRPRPRYDKDFLTHVDLVICEIIGCADDPRRVAQLFEALYQLHIWRGTRKLDLAIIEGLDHIAVMIGLDTPRAGPAVAEMTWGMCCQFVGPKYVPMTGGHAAYVLRCLEPLRTLAEFNFEFGHGCKTADAVVEYLQRFLEIGLWYSRREIANAVLRVYGKSLAACYEGRTCRFKYGLGTLRRSLRQVSKMLRQEQPDWSSQMSVVERLLSSRPSAKKGKASKVARQ